MTTAHPRYRSRSDASVGELVQEASQELTDLVRAEMRLAQTEMTQKGKRLGVGGASFGGAGLVGFLALQAMVATAIAALAVPLPVWAAALIITGALLVVAALMAAFGRAKVARATPPTPEQTVDSVKADLAEIKERAQR
ncbi:phage holin family protein [Streptomyces sp. NPDC051243]|uniref:phage holin family protein n=1 Tax=Streptomyces sp. NPDC051243 TaxID=3365646 RepID=UPI0037B1BE9B